MKTRILFILTILLFITIIINRKKVKKKEHYKKINIKKKEEKPHLSWKFFYDIVKENFMNGTPKKKEKKKEIDSNYILSPMYDSTNKPIVNKLKLKKFVSPILKQEINNDMLNKYGKYKKETNIKEDLIKCKYNNKIKKKLRILSDEKIILNELLNIKIYRIIENFHNNETENISNKCNNKNIDLYYYLNIKLIEELDDILTISYNKVVIKNKGMKKIKYLENVPKGSLIKIFYNNRNKSLFVSKDFKKINLYTFISKNINKIEILGIQNDYNIINNHPMFTNVPLLIFKNTLIDGLTELIEADEDFKFKFYNKDYFDIKKNINYIPFDSRYTIDSRYNFYIDNDNEKIIIDNIEDFEINNNMLFRLIRKDSFIGNNYID
jgi:hypothetical protein